LGFDEGFKGGGGLQDAEGIYLYTVVTFAAFAVFLEGEFFEAGMGGWVFFRGEAQGLRGANPGEAKEGSEGA